MNICITGASRGIGRALALEFLSHGHCVFGGLRNSGDTEDIERDHPQRFFPVYMDVRDESSLKEAQKVIQARTPSLDILVNNAAILVTQEIVSLPNISIDEIVHTLDVNTLGPLRVAKALYPLMRKSKEPRIVNISSNLASISRVSDRRNFSYSISKAALNMLTRLLYRTLDGERFKVFAMHPGWVQTDMGGTKAPLSVDESAKGLFTYMLAWNYGDPEFLDFRGRPMQW